MKTLYIIGLCIILICYAEITSSESDELCCTWLNVKYNTSKPPQKLILAFDGTYASYPSETSVDALERGTFRIVKKWTDSKGNIWYQVEIQGPGFEKRYELSRISNNGKTLECVCGQNAYPTNIDTNYSTYRRYTRK